MGTGLPLREVLSLSVCVCVISGLIGMEERTPEKRQEAAAVIKSTAPRSAVMAAWMVLKEPC